VQLINRQMSCDGWQTLFYLQNNTFGEYWLDNGPFYNTQGAETSTSPVNTSVTAGISTNVTFGTDLYNNSQGAGDRPGIGILSTSFVSMTDSFKTYLVFNPNPNNTNNIWVTLGQVAWGWHGYAAFDVTSLRWQLITGSTNAPSYTDTDAFPMWTNVYSNSR
jgi:hypothetical protein